MFVYRFLSSLLLILISLALFGCKAKNQEIIVNNAQDLYSESVVLLNKDEFIKAAANFEAIEKEVPGSEIALKSVMLKSYAYYMGNKFDDSIFAAEDFIKLYPRDRNVSYMYYLKAMNYYRQMVDVERDQKLTLDALDSMRDVVQRFPDSRYAKDAIHKLSYIHSVLAGKEMAIGRSYLIKNIPSAAANRFRTVLMNYDDTIFAPEALYRMVEIYKSWGIKDQSLYYASMLGYNYPDSIWYKMAYDLVKTS